ncbi:MAG: regulatory protein RecX [Myxococcota bacterium]|nr:hypothetical protein [Myxococcales bacterium]MBF94753.1 hypothetical protein [Myxococcales bacterium]MEC7751365.1 regulatory protein RecX [Myxococcota bacterium]HBU48519.1 hypothetical protein [Myxococcales bacterium]
MASSGSEKSRAYATCVRLLSRREYGSRALRRKLQDKGYSTSICDDVLAQLENSGLQSDERCAEAILRTGAHRGWSQRRCRARMLQEGLSEETIASAPWHDETEEQIRARNLYHKWIGDDHHDPKKRRRVLQRLARRGFAIHFLFDEMDEPPRR